MTARAMSPARPANSGERHGLRVDGPLGGGGLAGRLTTSTFPPVAGYCFASAAAADTNAAMLAPGRSRMPAVVP